MGVPLNHPFEKDFPLPIGSMVLVYIYIYANIGGILMVNVTIYSLHGSYGLKNNQLLGIPMETSISPGSGNPQLWLVLELPRRPHRNASTSSTPVLDFLPCWLIHRWGRIFIDRQPALGAGPACPVFGFRRPAPLDSHCLGSRIRPRKKKPLHDDLRMAKTLQYLRRVCQTW